MLQWNCSNTLPSCDSYKLPVVLQFNVYDQTQTPVSVEIMCLNNAGLHSWKIWNEASHLLCSVTLRRSVQVEPFRKEIDEIGQLKFLVVSITTELKGDLSCKMHFCTSFIHEYVSLVFQGTHQVSENPTLSIFLDLIKTDPDLNGYWANSTNQEETATAIAVRNYSLDFIWCICCSELSSVLYSTYLVLLLTHQ